MSSLIGALRVTLGLDTAAFDKGARQATSSVDKLRGGMAKFAGAVAGAFVASGVIEGIQEFAAASRKAIDAVGGLGEAAAAVGVTSAALQEFRYAATQVGLSTEQMDGILAQFSKRLGQGLITGKGGFVDGLKAIGLSLDDLKGKTTAEQFGVIADAINKVGSEAEKSALLTQFFGKQGQAAASLLADGSAGIRQYAEDARKLGLVVSDAQIKQADAASDQAAALERVAEAQQNAILSTPENIKATLEYTRGMTELKVAAMEAFGSLVRGASDNDAAMKRWRDSFTGALADNDAAMARWRGAIVNAVKSIGGLIGELAGIGRDMVLGLARGIRNNASAVWEALKGVVTGGIAKAKDLLGIHSPSRVFMEIGDYIGQGLAIGIEGGAGRVAGATQKLTEAARAAAEETRALFARLFPEIEAAKGYQDDLNRIANSGVSDDAKSEARFRLGREFTGSTGPLPVDVVQTGAADVADSVDQVLGKFDLFGKKAGAVTVTVAKSFKDMADATVQSLQNLASAVKGGGFLDILSAVVGLGLQLGSIGVFGKNVAARINAPKTPAYAGGTNFHPGGLAMVGERGPELVDLPRGSRVWPNGTGPAQTQRLEIVDTTGLFRFRVNGQIMETAPAIMQGSAHVAQKQIGYRQRRRVA